MNCLQSTKSKIFYGKSQFFQFTIQSLQPSISYNIEYKHFNSDYSNVFNMVLNDCYYLHFIPSHTIFNNHFLYNIIVATYQTYRFLQSGTGKLLLRHLSIKTITVYLVPCTLITQLRHLKWLLLTRALQDEILFNDVIQLLLLLRSHVYITIITPV